MSGADSDADEQRSRVRARDRAGMVYTRESAVESGHLGYSSGWREMAGGSRPPRSQLTAAAISGMPARVHTSSATGTLSRSDS
jgi:hypothetical protein